MYFSFVNKYFCENIIDTDQCLQEGKQSIIDYLLITQEHFDDIYYLLFYSAARFDILMLWTHLNF